MYLLIGAGGVSSYTFLGSPGWAFDKGVPALYVVIYLTYMALIAWYFGPKVNELGLKFHHVTQSSSIADRYESKGLGAVASIATAVGTVCYAVIQSNGAAIIFNIMSYVFIPIELLILISLVVVDIYYLT